MIPKISILIPFLNEEESLERLISELTSFVKKKSVEIVFIDDGSTDDSISVLKKSISSQTFYQTKLSLIKLSKNFGSHAALRAGIHHAKGQYITFMYADLQDPIDLVDKMQDYCVSGTDIVWASRRNLASGVIDKMFSRMYSYLMRKFAIDTYPKKGFDVVMFNQKVQRALNENIESNSSIFLQILSLGFSQKTIEYKKKIRKEGKSKWTLKKKLKLFIDSFVGFSYAPMRLVSIVGILFFIFGLIWTIYIITRSVLYGDLREGWPATVSILLLGFGITNIGLGVVAEYIWRTLDASRKRPVFIIDEIIELKNE